MDEQILFDWMPLEIEKFFGSMYVQGMKDFQRWWYISLLMRSWRNEEMPCHLPNDENLLWMVAGAESKEFFGKHSAIVIGRFQVVGDGQWIVNKKLLAIYQRQVGVSNVRSDAAKKRWGKGKDANPMQLHSKVSNEQYISSPLISSDFDLKKEPIEVEMNVQAIPDWEDAWECSLWAGSELGLDIGQGSDRGLIEMFKAKIIGEARRLTKSQEFIARSLVKGIQERPNKGMSIRTWLQGGLRDYLEGRNGKDQQSGTGAATTSNPKQRERLTAAFKGSAEVFAARRRERDGGDVATHAGAVPQQHPGRDHAAGMDSVMGANDSRERNQRVSGGAGQVLPADEILPRSTPDSGGYSRSGGRGPRPSSQDGQANTGREV